MVLDWLKASRPLNVLIIALIQFLLYFKLFWEDNISTILSQSQVAVLVLVTCLITIGGYYINDYFDKETDLSNNKTNKHSLSSHQLWIGYTIVSILGLLLSINLAAQIGKLGYLAYYFLAIGLLYYYSAKAKGQGLLGNMLVSLFCTSGLLIILLAEWETFTLLKLSQRHAYLEKITLLTGFSVFAGFITMIRELIKDIEDIAGDKAAGINTFAVKYGIRKARLLSTTYTVLTTLMASAWCFTSYYLYTKFASILFILTIIPTLLIFIYLQVKASQKEHYSNISLGLKVLMINAIVYLYFA